MFCTGIENSIPTINGGRTRVDQMEVCGHYKRWEEDFSLVEEMGIQYLRFGPPLHRTYLGPGRYDWDFPDITLADLKRRNITPIVDLCHFGVPDWIGNFQNPDFPMLFARYAADFAERYHWIQLYTPVNEMFICAIFSAKYGWWNEQMTTDQGFVTALKHIVKANVLAMTEILKRRPDAIFIQSESSEYFHADSPAAIGPAEIMNARRFLSLDLNYGRRVDSEMYEYLMDNGMTREEYHFFLGNHLKQHCILGNDYYWTNEHRIHADGHTWASGEVFGYSEITRQYYSRYGLPVMHTETNLKEGPRGDEAVNWLWKEWANVLRLRNVGIPTVGFTWYSLTDQVDWDTGLREQNGTVNPLGLYDLDRNIRNVGKAYKQLISDWRDVLPAQSVCLVVPVVPPSQSDDEVARRQERAAVPRLHQIPAQSDSVEGGIMKIGRIETFFVPPRWLFVRVESEDGAVGWGEASLEGHAEAVDGAFEPLRDRFIGHDPRRIEDIWQVAYRGGFYRGGPVLMSALAGFEQALWDMKGKVFGMPAWEMLGGKVREKIRAYAWIGGDRPDDIAEAARARRAQGFSAVKMNATAELDFLGTPKLLDDVVKRVQAAQGEGMDVGLDFHGRVHRPMAKQLAKLLEPLGLLFIEEPLLAENPEGLVQLSQLISTPIALGERLYSRWDFKPFLASGAVDIIQPDLSHAGGLLECRKIAAMAEAYDVAVAPHCPLGPLALAACVQLAGCTPNVAIQEISLGIHYNVGHDLLSFVTNPEMLQPQDGSLIIPEAPGLGVLIDEEAVREAHKDRHRWRNPVWRYADGSFAEW